MGYSNVVINADKTFNPGDVTSVGLNSNGTITNNTGSRAMVNLLDSPYANYKTFYGFYYIPTGTHELSSIFVADPETGANPPSNLAGCYVHLASTSNPAKEFPIVPPYSACGAPTVCSLGKTLSSGENVSLSWSGATAGTANAVTGYEVQRAESTNGSTWGSWAALTVTTATSLAVAPPSTYGNYYRYRVRTRGAAGESFYSAWKVCANTLRRDHAPLAGFTDSPLVAGATPVKALHMTELQSRVNELRAFYGLSAYSFSPIDARGIAGWTGHVKEIRAALDAIGKSHEAWLAIPVNCPRADVIEQLRAVALAT